MEEYHGHLSGNTVCQRLRKVERTEQLVQVEQIVHEDPRPLVGKSLR